MSKLKVYSYAKCGTCKKALKELDRLGVSYELYDIAENPPPKSVLKSALKGMDGDVKKLFNTSGMSYREGGFKEKLPSMSLDEAMMELSADGKLVKRPLVTDGKVGVCGFKPELWSACGLI